MFLSFRLYHKKTWLRLCLFFGSVLCSLSAFSNTDSLLNLTLQKNTDTVRIDAFIQLGMNHIYSDTAASRNYFESAIRISDVKKNFKRSGNAWLGLGILYHTQGLLNNAVEAELTAIDRYEKANYEKGMARCYNNLGAVYNLQDNYPKALDCYKKSLKIKRKIGDEAGYAASYNNIGTVYARQGNLDDAKKMFTESLILERKFGNKKGESESLYSLANVAFFMKEWSESQKLFEQALFILDSIGDIPSMTRCLEAMGSNYVTDGQTEKAIEYLLHARSLMHGWNTPYDLERIYESLNEAYKQKGDYRLASIYADSLISIRKSNFSIELAQQSEELITKYEAEKQKNEIKELESKNQLSELKANKNQLWNWILAILSVVLFLIFLLFYQSKKSKHRQNQHQLEQKALRAQMNPHFLFNSLNSIQRMYVEGELDKANEYTADFAELMRRILDNSNRNYISLKEELDTLKLYLELEKVRCGEMMNYEIIVDDALDLISIKVPPMIIQPFVENAIWHGILPKKEIGKVTISLRLDKNAGQQIICIIEDNGIGMSNTDYLLDGNRKHEPKGIVITEQRLGTKIKIDNLQTGGTKVTLFITV